MNEIIKIKINEIDDLNVLVESIKLNGLLVPIVVRRKDDHKYEMLSGHRRKLAEKKKLDFDALEKNIM